MGVHTKVAAQQNVFLNYKKKMCFLLVILLVPSNAFVIPSGETDVEMYDDGSPLVKFPARHGAKPAESEFIDPAKVRIEIPVIDENNENGIQENIENDEETIVRESVSNVFPVLSPTKIKKKVKTKNKNIKKGKKTNQKQGNKKVIKNKESHDHNTKHLFLKEVKSIKDIKNNKLMVKDINKIIKRKIIIK